MRWCKGRGGAGLLRDRQAAGCAAGGSGPGGLKEEDWEGFSDLSLAQAGRKKSPSSIPGGNVSDMTTQEVIDRYIKVMYHVLCGALWHANTKQDKVYTSRPEDRE